MDEPRILLVDDEPQVRKLMRVVLQTQGLRTVEAANGEEALRVLEDGGCNVDLVISDYHLSGIDGGRLTQSLKNRFPSLPVILISTDHYLSDLPGHDAFVPKPFDGPMLVAAALRLLGIRK